MWFKNLLVYRLPADWSMTAAQLEERLANRPLQPCNGFELQMRGWVAPAFHERLVHTLNGQHLIALGINQKLLPASIVNQVTKERAAEIAVEQGYPVGRRQLREIKERVTEELRGRALTRRRMMRAWIDGERGWLVVDSASPARAEELVETLRDSLGSLAVQLLETERSPTQSMSAWLMLGEAPTRFQIEEDLELQSVDDSKSMVRYVRHPLPAAEVQKHMSAGKTPTRLGLSWKDRLAFLLNADMQLKRVQFLGMDKESEQGSEAAEEKFDIDFTLMTGEVGQMLTDLIDALGGDSKRMEQLAAA